MRLHDTLIALLLTTWAVESSAGNDSVQSQTTVNRTVEDAYFTVLFEQVCARRPKQAAGADLQDELSRLDAVRSEASRRGLDGALREAERKWADFSSRAEWDCSREVGVDSLRQAIEKFAAAVASAARR